MAFYLLGGEGSHSEGQQALLGRRVGKTPERSEIKEKKLLEAKRRLELLWAPILDILTQVIAFFKILPFERSMYSQFGGGVQRSPLF